MRTGDHKLFAEKPLLYRAVNLRLNGYATTSLALIFNCHRSSIETQLDRYQVTPIGPVYTIERIASDALFHLVPPEPKWEEVDGERISKGKSYKEYLQESQFKRTIIRIT
jgi:hypothetical protein